MKFSRFFIDRPILSGVFSLLIFLAGLISLWQLPVAEYPDVAPPSVTVTAFYPGANPEAISQTVAAPLENQINGVENMLYMSSQASSSGMLSITVTFKVGTNPDEAQQWVQNRVNQALPRLPDVVRQAGVTAIKASSDLMMVVHLVSPNQQHDLLYLANYAALNIKDKLAALPGVGRVEMFGSSDYAMRIWLQPDKIVARGLQVSEVIHAIREQNAEVAAGIIGAAPSLPNQIMQLNVVANGTLKSVAEFENIIVKSLDSGAVIKLGEVARVELGSEHYLMNSLLDNKPAVAMGIFQAPGSNTIKVSQLIRKTMGNLQKNFPNHLEHKIVYDPTIFIKDSIKAVVKTLIEAIALVVLVVILFLQTWRASIIPLLAVPVSIVGTFLFMHFFGFSVNSLTLFGLVLAIGIVVDDAIVVVENIERNIAKGLKPKEAAYQAMEEVSGPIIAITLCLVAVFVPIAFVSGLNGQFYQQFALTIAISTVISALNSLTFSPALAALLLKDHQVQKDRFSRWIEKSFGWVFVPFNRFFASTNRKYASTLDRVFTHKSKAMALYGMLIIMSFIIFTVLPKGYIPAQDKQYLVGFAQLPDGSSLERTNQVMERMTQISLNTKGVDGVVSLPGLSIHGFSVASNSGVMFLALKPFKERQGSSLTANAIAQNVNAQLQQLQEAFMMVISPPPILGVGTTGGFTLQIQDKAGLGNEALFQVIQAIQAKAWQTPELKNVYSGFQINVPQLYMEIDRTKAKQMGLSLQDVYDALQIYLGSVYVNDFNLFGKVYKVIAQADAPFRSQPQDITKIQVRNHYNEMIPLSSVLTVSPSYGPDRVMRYNGYRSAEINGEAAAGYSSGQAQAAIEGILKEILPQGMGYEWTGLVFQQKISGNSTAFIFTLCILLVFLVLAAQYESLTLPLAVIMIVPMSILCALLGVWITKGDNNIFTQIGCFVLAGLACKNSILIVEFARKLEQSGKSAWQAAWIAAQLRLRPILMTSIAFVMGVLPLVFSSGAGSEMRQAMGVVVFFGMLGVTLFGLFLTPIFYVIAEMFIKSKKITEKAESMQGFDEMVLAKVHYANDEQAQK